MEMNKELMSEKMLKSKLKKEIRDLKKGIGGNS